MRKILLLIVLGNVVGIYAQNNKITYTAKNKLPEQHCTEGLPGLHMHAFNAEIISHAFSKGEGVITFNKEITSIGAMAFYGCEDLISILIPNSVKEISHEAFNDCSSLKTMSIPNNVSRIESGTFAGCSSLELINIPEYLVFIGKRAFAGCKSLSAIIIPGYVNHIGEYAFASCTSLESIAIPNSVKHIDEGTFRNCISLTSVVIPNSVTSIGEEAFAGCRSLMSITIPNSSTFINYKAFEGCNNIVFNGDRMYHYDWGWGARCVNGYIDSILVYSDSSKSTLCGCAYTAKDVVIPYSVNRISQYAFKDCPFLSTITVPNSVTKIEYGAFEKCNNIVYYGSASGSPWGAKCVNGFTKDYLVYKDTALTTLCGCSILADDVVIPNSVTKIEENAFAGCHKVNIHVSVGTLPKYRALLGNIHNVNIVDDIDNNLQIFDISPLLAVIDSSLSFSELIVNNTIDANEQCKILFQITNNGKGAATNCEAKIIGTGATNGITFENIKLPTIAVGAKQTIEIPITADLNTIDGTVTFTIEVTEPNGYGIDPMTLTVNTKAFDAPLVKVVDYAVSGNGTIQKKQPFDLQLLLQNTKYGKAEDVDVILSVPAGVSLWEGEEKTHYANLNGGDQEKLNYQLAISGNYAETTVPINISIKEKYGKFAENKTINLALNQQLASATSVTLQGQQPQVQREAIAIGVLGSAVDKNIPVSQTVNKNTFVVIIANENYKSVASVPYALNDGMKFSEYCQKTLGIPVRNIKYIANATGNEIKAQVQWLENITNVFDDPNIIFYYAGHGIPDESSKTAYLLPTDGIGTDVSTGYKLDNLYEALGKMPSAHTTIFLDACFSGSKREEGMLANARGVAIKAKSGVPQGNMVVFSAAQGDETAYPNNDEGHGMFTYYLLKKLQETSGDVTLYDLGNYITKNVSQQSILLNGKSQTPSVTAASILGSDWKNWKLK